MLHLQLSSRVQCRRLLTPVSTFLFKLVDSVSTRANMWCLHEAPQLVRTQHYACIRTCCQRSDTFGSLFSDAYRSDWTGDETIFAPATNCGAGQVSAIAIVRVSGSACSIVLKKVVKKHFTCFQNPRTAVFTQLHDPTTNVSIDQSVVIWFPAVS